MARVSRFTLSFESPIRGAPSALRGGWRRLRSTAADRPGLGAGALKLRLTRIERYVLVRTLIGVGGALAILSSLLTLIDFVELSRSVGVKAHDASVLDIFNLTLLEVPAKIVMVTPFAFLFGVLAAYVNLNRRSELVALRAAGVSAWRFIFPAAGAAAVIGVLTVMVFDPVASTLNDIYDRISTEITGGAADPSKAIWLRQGDRHSDIILRAEAQTGPGVRLKRVVLFVYGVDRGGAAHFSRRIEAAEARLAGRRWVLTGVREGAPGAQAVRVDSMTLPSTLDEQHALERFSSPEAAPFWSLPGLIVRTGRAGFSTTAYRLQFEQLLATPLMYAAMSVLAAAFSLRLLRLGGLAALAGAGVALGFILFFFDQFCSALGRAEVIPPALAAWTPPLMALLAGFTLLCYTEDG